MSAVIQGGTQPTATRSILLLLLLLLLLLQRLLLVMMMMMMRLVLLCRCSAHSTDWRVWSEWRRRIGEIKGQRCIHGAFFNLILLSGGQQQRIRNAAHTAVVASQKHRGRKGR